MKRLWVVAFVMGLAVVVASQAMAAPPSVKVATKEGVGAYLVDSKDRALYYSKNDTPGKSTCVGECLQKWAIFSRQGIPASDELKASDFSPITREDGKTQSTYRGYPLYYFAREKPGEVKGNGMDGVWGIIDPKNFPPKK